MGGIFYVYLKVSFVFCCCRLYAVVVVFFIWSMFKGVMILVEMWEFLSRGVRVRLVDVGLILEEGGDIEKFVFVCNIGYKVSDNLWEEGV